jgi:hypothetical protein
VLVLFLLLAWRFPARRGLVALAWRKTPELSQSCTLPICIRTATKPKLP